MYENGFFALSLPSPQMQAKKSICSRQQQQRDIILVFAYMWYSNTKKNVC